MLFTTIDEIKTFLPIGAGNDFLKLKPHIQNAENKYLKVLLGTAMYDELQEFYETEYPATPSDVQIATKELLGKVQHAVIHLAYYLGFDFLNATVSAAGFQRTEGGNLKPLFKYQEDNLKGYFSDAGFDALDDVLVFLEENIEHFGEFKAETNYKQLKQSFLPTVKVVEEIPFNIQGSRLTLLAMQPSVKFIEDTTIRATMGDAIYLALKEEMILDNSNPIYIALLPYIRKPLVYLASALLMEETGATLADKGLYFEKTDATAQNTKIKSPSTEERIATMIARNRNMGNAYLDLLKSYLEQNFQTYQGTAVRFSRDNTGKKTFWA